MRSFASIILLTASALSGVKASDFSLKSFSTPVSTLKFGASAARRRAGENEELTLTLADGSDVVLALAPSKKLQHTIETCGSYGVGGTPYDIIVTGCEGDDRSITIGGEGSWAYDASSDSFRRLEDMHGTDEVSMKRRNACGSRMPTEDDKDAMMMQKTVEDAEASGELIKANLEQRSQFQMEVRYYYDQSLLEKYNGDHARAVQVINEMHEHTKVMMRHPSIGRVVHIDYSVEPKFAAPLRTHAGPDNALNLFMNWLNPQGLCRDDIAFHHLITDRRNDGTSGVAWVGTVCHGRCFNTGITEVWRSSLSAAQTMAHEFGHNLGALHTFDRSNQGRNCDGIMNYGQRPMTWSNCSRERWTSDYDVFVRSFGQSRADQCFKPTSRAPVPSPTPVRPAPVPSPTPVRPSPRPAPTPTRPVPAPTPANPPAATQWMRGYCTVNREDQNSGVLKVSSQNMNSDNIREQCLDVCKTVSGATGCEVVWDQINQGCYVHTQRITEASGAARHYCAIFGSSTPAAPAPTPAVPAPRPTAPAPSPTPDGEVTVDWVAVRNDASLRTMSIAPGTVLSIEFNGSHTVHMMQSADALDFCSFGGAQEIGSGQSGQTTVKMSFPANARPGSQYFFACAIGSHCRDGMRLTVTIGEPAASEWTKTNRIWNDAQCPNMGSKGLGNTVDQCQKHCLARAGCTAINFNPNNGDCVLRGCAVGTEPTWEHPAYDGYHSWGNEDPVSLPPAPVCECVGTTNSLGEGGARCDSFDADSAQQWCYVSPNACQDGEQSTVLSGHEWSYMACQ